jgi:hypothetical protein
MTTERDMTVEDFQPDEPNRVTIMARRISGSAKVAKNGATNLVGRLPATVKATRARASNIVGRLPATARATQAGVRATTSALQQLPDSTLQSLAASSAGLGAGLYLAGKTKLAVAAGVIPALFVGAAIAWRPAKSVAPAKPSI